MRNFSRFIGVAALATFTLGASIASANPRLADQVVIRRTEYGVPHILAENERALGFGLAYAQAEDYMVPIMKLIIRARGESAKLLEPTDSNINADFWNKQYRIHARAKETFNDLDKDWRHITEGFAEGLNYYIENHRDELPDFVQPVTKYDVAAHGLTGVSRFALNRGGVVRKLQQKLAGGESGLAGESNEEELEGSNMWAFSGDRTTTGDAILMGNPHQSWSDVSTYYEAHVTIPGKLNFYGSTFIGRPVLTTGFNNYLGWTHTVNYPDIEEIYAFDRDSSRSNRYTLDGKSHKISSETVTVEYTDVHGVDVVETRTFRYTEWGPVVHMNDDLVYVHRPVAYFDYRYYQHWYRLGLATSYDEWRAELDKLIMPMFNTGYADREGNIYYRWNGSIPKLVSGSHRDEAVHVTKANEIWTEYVAAKDLPQLKNPAGGYIMNSNSSPHHTNLHAVMPPEQFPDYFPEPRFSLRSQHSMHLIHNDRKFSLEDIVKLKHSQRSLAAERMKDDLIAALSEESLNDTEVEALNLLKSWDNSTARESVGSVIFQEWLTLYRKDKDDKKIYATPWDYDNPIETPHGIANLESAVAAFRAAVEDVVQTWGRIDVTWGDVHRLRIGDNVDIPVGGGGGAIGAFRILGFTDDDDGKRRARGGDSWIFTVNFGEIPEAYSVVAYSQSSREDSPHFADQAEIFANDEMKKVAFTEEAIAATLIKQYHPGEE